MIGKKLRAYEITEEIGSGADEEVEIAMKRGESLKIEDILAHAAQETP